MGQRCVRLRIRGRVQGVFYRDSTRREAQRLGLRGWVRNRSDGSVEVVALGPLERIAALIDWCWLGWLRSASRRNLGMPTSRNSRYAAVALFLEH